MNNLYTSAMAVALLTGTAMAAGVLPPLMPAGAHLAPMQAGHTHGDAVDVDASAAVVAAADDLSHHHSTGASPAGHPPQAAAPCDSASSACGAQEHHANTCSACEICHSAVLAPSVPLVHAAPPRGHTRPMASAPFRSAPAALAIKPPIA